MNLNNSLQNNLLISSDRRIPQFDSDASSLPFSQMDKVALRNLMFSPKIILITRIKSILMKHAVQREKLGDSRWKGFNRYIQAQTP